METAEREERQLFFCVTGGVFFALLLRIHDRPVADGRAGAVMRKLLRIQCDGRTDRRTDLPTNTARCRIACPRLKIHIIIIISKIRFYPRMHYNIDLLRDSEDIRAPLKNKKKKLNKPLHQYQHTLLIINLFRLIQSFKDKNHNTHLYGNCQICRR